MFWFIILFALIIALFPIEKTNYWNVLKYEIKQAKSIAFISETKTWLVNGVVNLIFYYGDKNISYFFVDGNYCEGQYFMDNNILNPINIKGDIKDCKKIWKNYDLIFEFRVGKYKIEKYKNHYIFYSTDKDFYRIYYQLKALSN